MVLSTTYGTAQVESLMQVVILQGFVLPAYLLIPFMPVILSGWECLMGASVLEAPPSYSCFSALRLMFNYTRPWTCLVIRSHEPSEVLYRPITDGWSTFTLSNNTLSLNAMQGYSLLPRGFMREAPDCRQGSTSLSLA